MKKSFLCKSFGSQVILAAVCIAVASVFVQLIMPSQAGATYPYSKETQKKCYYCHANMIGEECVLTEQGVYWWTHNKSFEGMPAELVPGPPPPPEAEKNTPVIGMIVGTAFFLAILVMIVSSIIKKPVSGKHVENSPESDISEKHGKGDE